MDNLNNSNLSTIISFIVSNKSFLEVSQYEGDIFWLNNMCFGPSAFTHNYRHISLYPGDKPGIYFSVADTNCYTQTALAVIKKYANGDNLLKDFYQHQLQIITAAENLTKSPPQEVEAYIAMANEFINFSKVSVFSLEALDFFLHSKLKEKIVDPDEIALLTMTRYSSYVNQCEQDLRRISKIPDKHDFEIEAKKHIAEWFWAYTNYKPSAQITVKDVRERIQGLSEIKLEDEKTKTEKLKQKKDLLAQKDQEINKLITFFDATMELRDQRKATLLRCITVIRTWLDSYAKFKHFDERKIRFLTWEEQLRLDKVNKKQLLSIAEDRLKGCANVFGFQKNESSILFTNDDYAVLAAAIFKREKFSELKGTTACPGNEIGRVKIVSTTEDFKTFREGDILVSSHTTPDYFCVMKKAKAIITERGGITSHAAIVSRELGKPCIVGIRGLIGSCKDGDMVEVDAENGIVKILE